MQLSVIIVNYNVKYFLEQCLWSVIAATKNIATEVFVIDNCSIDGSRIFFEDKFADVNFIWNTENMGFAKANNLILKDVKGDHILFLNPDTILPEDGLEKCLYFFSQNSTCGACGVRMIDGSGKFLPESKRTYPGLFSSLLKLSGQKKSSYYDRNIQEGTVGKTEVLSGAFMMLSKVAKDCVKGFDEDFFMYGEDIDLSYRLYKKGFQNYYLGDTSVIHFKGESTNKMSKKYFNDFYGAMQLFVSKHYNTISSFFINQFIGLAQIWAVFGLKRTGVKKEKARVGPAKFAIICKESNQEKLKGFILKFQPASTILFFPPSASTSQLENSLADVSPGDKEFLSFLVFCIPDISYTNAILAAQKLGEKFYCLFHNVHSESFAGSNDKNAKGFFIY